MPAATRKVSVNDLLVRATALALVQHPTVNAQLQGDEVVKFPQADICVAVASENGLVTPVVRAAETKSAAQIGTEVADLAERARSGRLTRDEITGGTFTISNLGMFGVDRFDAIINPPQVAILAVGAGIERVVARNGQPAVCRGRDADAVVRSPRGRWRDRREFLATLRELLESATAFDRTVARCRRDATRHLARCRVASPAPSASESRLSAARTTPAASCRATPARPCR